MHTSSILWPTDTKTWHLHYPTPNKTSFLHQPVSTKTTRTSRPKGQTTSGSPRTTSEISNTLFPEMLLWTLLYQPHWVPQPWPPRSAEHCPLLHLEDAHHRWAWPPFQTASLPNQLLPLRATLTMPWTSGRTNKEGRWLVTRPFPTPLPGRMGRSDMTATSVEKCLGSCPTSRYIHKAEWESRAISWVKWQ